jgi:hypothetical protein
MVFAILIAAVVFDGCNQNGLVWRHIEFDMYSERLRSEAAIAAALSSGARCRAFPP